MHGRRGRHELCRHIDGVGNRWPVAGRVVLHQRGQCDADAVILENALVGLLQQERLGDGLRGRNPDDSALSCERQSVYGELGTGDIGLIIDQESVVHIVLGLGVVVETQCITGSSTCGNVAYHRPLEAVHRQFRLLYLHGTFHENLLVRLII